MKIDDAPSVQVIHNPRKEVVGQSLPVFIVTSVPQASNLFHGVETKCQFDGSFFRLGSASFPMGYLALVLLSPSHIFFPVNDAITVEVNCCLNASMALGDSGLFLRLKRSFAIHHFSVILIGAESKFGHEWQRITPDSKQLDQPSEIIFISRSHYAFVGATADNTALVAIAAFITGQAALIVRIVVLLSQRLAMGTVGNTVEWINAIILLNAVIPGVYGTLDVYLGDLRQ